MIAALFVEKNGAYYGLPDVDPWDEERDARLYDGPYPVIAHPPCQRWGKMWAGQPLWIKRTGQRKKKGDDGGCFEAALAAVREYGGVLEHPMGSHAWAHFGLIRPPRNGGWVKADEYGGYTCCVEQGRYGHYAPKPTWLYAVGCELPELRWGAYKVKDDDFPAWAMEKYGREKCRKAGLLAFKGGGKDSSPRIHTPPEFRDLLISIAKTAKQEKKGGRVMTNDEVWKMCDDLKKAFGRRLPEKKLDDMVNRFLSWRLPNDFSPDAGIEFTKPDALYPNIENTDHLWPVGTNLFTAEQAKKMLEYVIFGDTNDQD